MKEMSELFTDQERIDALMKMDHRDYKKIALNFITATDKVADHSRRMELLHKAMFYANLYQTESNISLELR